MTPTRTKGSEAEHVIYQEIHRAIAERRLTPGEKLTEEALVDIFNVSRSRIRRVLLLLAKENVVRLERNRGAFVWRPTVADACNVLEARRIVELEIVRKAAQIGGSAHVRRLRKLVAKEQRAIRRSAHEEIMRLSGEFHIALAEVAANPVLAGFVRELISRCYLILATYQKYDHRNCPQDDHAAIVDAIAANDGNLAADLMIDHFKHIEDELDLQDRPKARQDLREIFRVRSIA